MKSGLLHPPAPAEIRTETHPLLLDFVQRSMHTRFDIGPQTATDALRADICSQLNISTKPHQVVERAVAEGKLFVDVQDGFEIEWAWCALVPSARKKLQKATVVPLVAPRSFIVRQADFFSTLKTLAAAIKKTLTVDARLTHVMGIVSCSSYVVFLRRSQVILIERDLDPFYLPSTKPVER